MNFVIHFSLNKLEKSYSNYKYLQNLLRDHAPVHEDKRCWRILPHGTVGDVVLLMN